MNENCVNLEFFPNPFNEICFEFKSKVTTGGKMRKFEVPQYTQIGNAVPPLLGLALGEVCRALIDIAEQES